LRHFFEEYKALENKTVSVEEFQDKTRALAIVEEGIENYKKLFKK
jgi:inorganic pyrophosphatase